MSVNRWRSLRSIATLDAVEGSTSRLHVLQDEVDERVQQMERSHGAWPCRAGCDTCCRRLGALPSVSDVEFAELWRGFSALPLAVRHQVRRRIATLAADAAGHYVCPLLDEESGRCHVYAVRPTACRTYGFYSGRDGDYWCDRVTEHIGDKRDTLVAGNQLAIDRRRDAQFGPSVDLVTRFAAAHDGSNSNE